jgi:hypothetical protein
MNFLKNFLVIGVRIRYAIRCPCGVRSSHNEGRIKEGARALIGHILLSFITVKIFRANSETGIPERSLSFFEFSIAL